MSTTDKPGLYDVPRDDWLALHREEIIDPALPIVDPHHHLWNRPGSRYLPEDFIADLDSGHNIVGTVYADCRFMYRADGPEHLMPVGEVEYAEHVASDSAGGGLSRKGLCIGIIGNADLMRGDGAAEVLEAEMAASARFRGIRQVTAWDADVGFSRPATGRPPGMMLDPGFRAGFAHLGTRGLSFDAFLFFTQIAELTSLAREFPATTIVLDHTGGPLGIGPYEGKAEDVFSLWHRAIGELSTCPNVAIKLGGLGMRSAGFAFADRRLPPSSEELAAAWRPYIESAIQAFGPSRAMFESNFVPDKGSCSYAVLWNAFKRLAAGYSASERMALFSGTANRVYRLAPSDQAITPFE